MEKAKALIALGRLEVRFEEKFMTLTILEQIENCILDERFTSAAIQLGMLQEHTKKFTSIYVEEELKTLEKFLVEALSENVDVHNRFTFYDAEKIVHQFKIEPSKLPSPYNQLFLPIEDAGFSCTVIDRLRRVRIKKIGEVVNFSPNDIKPILMARTSVFATVQKRIEEMGLEFHFDFSFFKRFLPIQSINLSPNTTNSLQEANINKICDLIDKTEEDILNIRSFDKKSLEEVKRELYSIGLELKSSNV